MALSTASGHGAEYHDERGSQGDLAATAKAPPDRRAPRKPNDLTLTGDYGIGQPSSALAGVGHWSDQAMCVNKTAIFFAPPGEREGRRRRREALASAYCAVCPIQEQCKQAGREGREHGIWGGENDEQRALAGFAPRSPHRRSVAEAARTARQNETANQSDVESGDVSTGLLEQDSA